MRQKDLSASCRTSPKQHEAYTDSVIKIVAEKKKGKLILITSHVLSELDDLVTEVIYMQDGILKFHKSFEDLQAITGQVKLSKAIATVMLSIQLEQKIING